MTIRKPEGPAILELTDVSKAFGPVQALSNVSLKLAPGQVHCLAGENGAGKSTLIRVLTGALHRDSGDYDIEGHPVTTATPAALRAAGVQAVYQELSLLPHLSVGENMFMGRLPSRSGIVRQRRPAQPVPHRARPARPGRRQPRHDRRTPPRRHQTTRRDRQGADRGLGQGHRVRRADHRAHRSGVRPAARPDPPIPRAGGGHAVRHPPAGGDVRDRRLGNRPAGRRSVPERPDVGLRREQADHRHGRPRGVRAVPRRGQGTRSGPAERPRPAPDRGKSGRGLRCPSR